jgi:hypothetical protein
MEGGPLRTNVADEPFSGFFHHVIVLGDLLFEHEVSASFAIDVSIEMEFANTITLTENRFLTGLCPKGNGAFSANKGEFLAHEPATSLHVECARVPSRHPGAFEASLVQDSTEQRREEQDYND